MKREFAAGALLLLLLLGAWLSLRRGRSPGPARCAHT